MTKPDLISALLAAYDYKLNPQSEFYCEILAEYKRSLEKSSQQELQKRLDRLKQFLKSEANYKPVKVKHIKDRKA